MWKWNKNKFCLICCYLFSQRYRITRFSTHMLLLYFFQTLVYLSLKNNPLASARHFPYVCFWDFLINLFFHRFLCKFYTGEPCPWSVCCKKQKQFTIYTTHFVSVYVPKSRFRQKKGIYMLWRSVKKPKTLFDIFLKRLQII